jgi:hypothetical protein
MTDFAHIFRWDLDKTYLKTDFSSLRGMLRTAFEPAEAKKSVPGAPALLRELRAAGRHGIFFISGSPREMRKVLMRKLAMDGVEVDGLVLKPNLQNLLRGRFRALREQVGYKLPTLLEERSTVRPGVPETLFGDDAEADAFIYSLYADLLAGKVGLDLLEEVLARAGAYPDDCARTLELAQKMTTDNPVRRIFIHLDKHSPPARFERYSRRVAPIANYFQAALVLFSDGVLGSAAVLRVAREMIEGHGYDLGALANSFQDVVRRGFLRYVALPALAEAVLTAGDLTVPFGPAHKVVQSFADRVRGLAGPREGAPAAQAPIDYLRALEEDVRRPRRRERGSKKDRRPRGEPIVLEPEK